MLECNLIETTEELRSDTFGVKAVFPEGGELILLSSTYDRHFAAQFAKQADEESDGDWILYAVFQHTTEEEV